MARKKKKYCLWCFLNKKRRNLSDDINENEEKKKTVKTFKKIGMDNIFTESVRIFVLNLTENDSHTMKH